MCIYKTIFKRKYPKWRVRSAYDISALHVYILPSYKIALENIQSIILWSEEINWYWYSISTMMRVLAPSPNWITEPSVHLVCSKRLPSIEFIYCQNALETKRFKYEYKDFESCLCCCSHKFSSWTHLISVKVVKR